ncbi:MAG: GldG family protein [Bdellovibrionaceae bacterium]|nr:GldG family protein [Pseudobdellovibrionaceae bacterium]
MSKKGKACLLISGLFILASGVARLVLGVWDSNLLFPIVLAALFFAAGLLSDWRTIIEFLTMRTTKHGMNMGALIVIVLIGLVSINFIAVRNDKRLDWTSEGLNSLSPQSEKAAKAIQEDLKIVLLSRRDQDQARAIQAVQEAVDMYRSVNSKITFTHENARQRPDLAQKYNFNQGAFGIFAEYKGKQIRIEKPTEEEITKTLIRLTRDTKKTVYVTEGHGERGLEDQGAEGLSFLKEDLATTYDVKPIRLVDTQKIPEDAAAILIAGPQQQFLESELQILRNYARGGGRLLIAIDPGTRHNLAQLTKTLGVEFKGNYVLDPRAQIPGRGNIAALGSVFSTGSEITKPFTAGQMAVFQLASVVTRAPDAATGLQFEELVRTDAMPISTHDLSSTEIRPDARGPFTLAVSVSGKLPLATDDPNAPKENKDFSAVVFGDSDFLSNQLFQQNLNRDLVMNSVAYLSQDGDMISIRPKQPKGSVLNLTRGSAMALLFGFLIPLPILFLSTGGVIWYRRKSA